MIVYKSADRYIIKMCIPEDSITNMSRGDIVIREYAKYRCDKVEVIDIYDKNTREHINTIPSNYDNKFIYNVRVFISCFVLLLFLLIYEQRRKIHMPLISKNRCFLLVL